ncbi:hypothetical protein [Ectobacillus polymachus]|uniref:hypothetical protein n=1 Tax=Ectobacillus polymachus TaxID=1508806 RepID=UPI003A8550E0
MWKDDALKLLKDIEESNGKGFINPKSQFDINKDREIKIENYEQKLNDLSKINLNFYRVVGKEYNKSDNRKHSQTTP